MQKTIRWARVMVIVCLVFSSAGCFCMQDEGNGNQILINEKTGGYSFKSCGSGFTLMGTGTVKMKGSTIALDDSQPDRRVVVRVDLSVGRGTAAVQYLPTGVTYTIQARNILPTCPSCGM